MNLSGKGAFGSDSKLTTLKSTSLNPHAAEFVPFALQPSSRIVSSADASSKGATSASVTSGKTVLDRSESSVSNNSDDEIHQYWRQQLPDDITPDFNVVGEDESQGFNNLSLSGLSISNANEASRFSASAGSDLMLQVMQELSPRPLGENSFTERVRAPLSYGEDPSADCFQSFLTNSWDEQITNNDQFIANARGGPQLNGNVGHGLFPDMLNEQLQMDYTDINPVEFLSSEFPGFSTESLGEVYFANGGELNLTVEMLTQLEARQAYLIGNKALAKELSVKGQLHNMQMKEAHGKAQESIYRQSLFCCLYQMLISLLVIFSSTKAETN